MLYIWGWGAGEAGELQTLLVLGRRMASSEASWLGSHTWHPRVTAVVLSPLHGCCRSSVRPLGAGLDRPILSPRWLRLRVLSPAPFLSLNR